MADAPAADWRRRAGLAFGAVCLLVAVYLQLGSPRVGAWLLDAGYSARVAGHLLDGHPHEALEVLDRVPGVSALTRSIERDVRLRRAIARALTDELGRMRGQNADQRALLDSATNNAELLVQLAAADPQSHFLLGLVYLKRGELRGAPIDFILSARHLRTALRLDPEIRGAADALRVALLRARP
jgi:hypothetical protein